MSYFLYFFFYNLVDLYDINISRWSLISSTIRQSMRTSFNWLLNILSITVALDAVILASLTIREYNPIACIVSLNDSLHLFN